MKYFLLIFCSQFVFSASPQNSITLPLTGSTTANPAGNSVLIYDNGGASGSYSSNSSGYIYLTALAGQTITISGGVDIESSYDFFKIFSGNGLGGAVRWNSSNSYYWFTYTGNVGEGLTIQLTSDGSLEYKGLHLLVTYSSTTQLNIPSSGNNSVSCGNNRTLFDGGGRASNYTRNNNGYTVFNCSPLSQITLLGAFDTELSFDVIRIFSGSGLGGTLLGTYSGDISNATSSFIYTGSLGQTLTVQFLSDNSFQYSGFELSAKYSGVCSALPVELISFNANCEEVFWRTASETNCDYFLVESSFDGENWNVLDSVAGSGNSSSEIEYSIALKERRGFNFYRLKQIDFNGDTEVYDPVSVFCSSNKDYISISPNPSNGNFTLEMYADKSLGLKETTIYDSKGSQVYNKNLDIKNGTTVLSFNLELDSGVYFMRVGEIVEKFVIIK